MSSQTNKQANKQANNTNQYTKPPKTENIHLMNDEIYIINDYINNIKLMNDDNEIIKNYIKGLYLIKLCLKYVPNDGNIKLYELNETEFNEITDDLDNINEYFNDNFELINLVLLNNINDNIKSIYKNNNFDNLYDKIINNTDLINNFKNLIKIKLMLYFNIEFNRYSRLNEINYFNNINILSNLNNFNHYNNNEIIIEFNKPFNDDCYIASDTEINFILNNFMISDLLNIINNYDKIRHYTDNLDIYFEFRNDLLNDFDNNKRISIDMINVNKYLRFSFKITVIKFIINNINKIINNDNILFKFMNNYFNIYNFIKDNKIKADEKFEYHKNIITALEATRTEDKNYSFYEKVILNEYYIIIIDKIILETARGITKVQNRTNLTLLKILLNHEFITNEIYEHILNIINILNNNHNTKNNNRTRHENNIKNLYLIHNSYYINEINNLIY